MMIESGFTCFHGARRPAHRWGSLRRDGFALMATLWVVVAIAAVTFSMAESAHLLMYGARNRTNARVATWRAIGCFARIRAKLAEDAESSNRIRAIWDSLDVYVAAQDGGCKGTAFASGMVIDINHAPAPTIDVALTAAGADPTMISNIMALTVAGGHRPYGSDEEMEAIAGAAMRRAEVDNLFGVDTGRVVLRRAPWPVQMGAMANTLRDSGQDGGDVSREPSSSPTSGLSNAAAISAADSPEAWWLRIEATQGDPPATVRLEAHVVFLGGSIGIEDVRLR